LGFQTNRSIRTGGFTPATIFGGLTFLNTEEGVPEKGICEENFGTLRKGFGQDFSISLEVG